MSPAGAADHVAQQPGRTAPSTTMTEILLAIMTIAFIASSIIISKLQKQFDESHRNFLAMKKLHDEALAGWKDAMWRNAP